MALHPAVMDILEESWAQDEHLSGEQRSQQLLTVLHRDCCPCPQRRCWPSIPPALPHPAETHACSLPGGALPACRAGAGAWQVLTLFLSALMNCFTLTYVLQKPEDSSERGAQPLPGLLLGKQLLCRRWLCPPAPWHPHLGLAQQHPLAWLWEGAHQAYGPTVGTATTPPTGIMGLQETPALQGQVSAHSHQLCCRGLPGLLPRGPLSHQPHGARSPARHWGLQDHPAPSPGAPAQEVHLPKLTHCVSSPVEKALATHCRSSGLKGTRTRWTPGSRFTALSGYMK